MSGGARAGNKAKWSRSRFTGGTKLPESDSPVPRRMGQCLSGGATEILARLQPTLTRGEPMGGTSCWKLGAWYATELCHVEPEVWEYYTLPSLEKNPCWRLPSTSD